MRSIKYLGAHVGPSHGSLDDEYMQGFYSLADARKYYLTAQRTTFVPNVEYRRNGSGVYVPWSEGTTWMPSTTEDDTLTLYVATNLGDGTYDKDEYPAYVIIHGAREQTTRIEKF